MPFIVKEMLLPLKEAPIILIVVMRESGHAEVPGKTGFPSAREWRPLSVFDLSGGSIRELFIFAGSASVSLAVLRAGCPRSLAAFHGKEKYRPLMKKSALP